MENPSEYRLAEIHCPACHSKMNAVIDCSDEGRRPRRGDFTICAYCAAFLRFSSLDHVVLVTEEELQTLGEREPQALMMLRTAKTAVRQMIRERTVRKMRKQALLN